MSRTQNTVLALVILLFSGVACSGLAGDPEIVATLPAQTRLDPEVMSASVPVVSPSVDLGGQIYAENCTSCHGETGAGDGALVLSGEIEMTADFTAPEANDDISPADWYEVITNGRLEVLMPPWSGSLSDMERWSVTMYLYTLSYPAEQIATGQTLYARECAECHAEDGTGTVDGVALTGFHDQSDNALLAQITEGSADMPAFAETLSTEERAAVVTHIRSLTADSSVSDDARVAAPAANAVPPPPQQMVTGNITGSIIHGTTGGTLPDEMTATLHLMDSEFGNITLDSPVTTEGSYSFEGIPLDPGHTLVVSVEYNDATFVSDFVSGTVEAETLELPVVVYDLTYDPGVIRVGSIVSQVFTDQHTLQVFEIIEVWNDSDRIYMGTDADDDGVDGNQTISFTIPANAEFIDITGEGRYTVSEDGRVVTDSLPVVPGDAHVVHMAYILPYQDRTTITQTMSYPLEGRIEVHADTHDLGVESELLAHIGSYQPSATTSLTAYGNAASMAVGDTYSYDVVGIASAVAATSTTSTGSDDDSILPYILLGFGITMVFGSGGFLMMDSRRKRNQNTPETVPEPTIDEIIQRIAALDMAFDADEIEESAYYEKRAALKRQVATMMSQETGGD